MSLFDDLIVRHQGQTYRVVYHHQVGYMLPGEELARLRREEVTQPEPKQEGRPKRSEKKQKAAAAGKRQAQRSKWNTYPGSKTAVPLKPPPGAVSVGGAYRVPSDSPVPEPWDWRKATLSE